MKIRIAAATALFAVSIVTVSAQTFPGLTTKQAAQLKNAKRYAQFALPTWLPEGFSVEKIDMKLGPRVGKFDKELAIVYARTLKTGKKQQFAIHCGFEELGDLPYEANHVVRSPVGTLYLFHGRADEELPPVEVSATHWHHIGPKPFAYEAKWRVDDSDTSYVMISLAETKKILASLRRF
jgi:hypothetical protein